MVGRYPQRLTAAVAERLNGGFNSADRSIRTAQPLERLDEAIRLHVDSKRDGALGFGSPDRPTCLDLRRYFCRRFLGGVRVTCVARVSGARLTSCSRRADALWACPLASLQPAHSRGNADRRAKMKRRRVGEDPPRYATDLVHRVRGCFRQRLAFAKLARP